MELNIWSSKPHSFFSSWFCGTETVSRMTMLINAVNPFVVVTQLWLAYSHPWTIVDFTSLTATGPTLQQRFSSSLIRRAVTAGTPAVSLQWHNCTLTFLTVLPPFFIFFQLIYLLSVYSNKYSWQFKVGGLVSWQVVPDVVPYAVSHNGCYRRLVSVFTFIQTVFPTELDFSFK